jgi:acyl carrier protein
MQAITRAQALKMFEEAFAADAGTLSESSTRADIPGWDSMGALMLITELDSRFGIVLSPEQSKTMVSVGDAVAFLKSQGCISD